jgi:pyridoxine 5-phosphate synthase
MVNLSVNINKIALLRNARGSDRPNVLRFARLALDAGAAGITVHPRPDQRHITAVDALELAQFMNDQTQEYNIEGNPFEGAMGSFPGFMDLVMQAKPAQCTLVPDSIDQKTSDHGWNFFKDGDRLVPIINQLNEQGIRVSVFVDPEESAIDGAAKLGVDRIEFYTESYANAHETGDAEASFLKYSQLAKLAHDLGLDINAGHDLNLQNLPLFASLPYLKEVSIGQALVSDALEMGFLNAVSSYLECLQV